MIRKKKLKRTRIKFEKKINLKARLKGKKLIKNKKN